MYPVVLLLAAPWAADAPAQVPPPYAETAPPGVRITLAPPAAPADATAVRPAARPDVILRWNNTLLETIKAEKTPPPLAARNLAVMHVAMYDAVNGVLRTNRPYRVNAQPPGGTS